MGLVQALRRCWSRWGSKTSWQTQERSCEVLWRPHSLAVASIIHASAECRGRSGATIYLALTPIRRSASHVWFMVIGSTVPNATHSRDRDSLVFITALVVPLGRSVIEWPGALFPFARRMGLSAIRRIVVVVGSGKMNT